LGDAGALISVPNLIAGLNLNKLDKRNRALPKCEYDTFNDFTRGVLRQMNVSKEKVNDMKEKLRDIEDDNRTSRI